MYQTDFLGHIRVDGCLLCSIVTAVEEMTSLYMSKDDFLDMVNHLFTDVKTAYDSRCPALSDENDKEKPGSFVWDHVAVFHETFKRLGVFHKMAYTGRIYMPWEEAKGKVSFGEPKGDIIIMQIDTPYGGHFRLPNFDPWEPGTKMVNLKSLRYYSMR